MKLIKTFRSQAEATDWVRQNKKIVCPLYKRDDMTVETVCRTQGVEFSSYTTKAFYNVCGPKGKGWGGKRPGSGNDPGISFCKVCRKKLENCECKPA